MAENQKLLELHKLASSMTLLYVEDNEGLREQAVKLFKKFFNEVIVADNGQTGLESFKTHPVELVITDIKMPEMNGLEMAREIHAVAPHTKIIITSAYDDTAYLMEAINTGVFRYLKKPLSMAELTSTLLDGLQHIRREKEEQLFSYYTKTIFENQKNLLILYRNRAPVMVNQAGLEFFDTDNVASFAKAVPDLGSHFLPHRNFLYNDETGEWYTKAMEQPGRLFHVKMRDRDTATCHFIFKMVEIDGSQGYRLVSLDNVTELGLLSLFDEHADKEDKAFSDRSRIFSLIETAQRNNAEIKLHNHYKGLTIANPGMIDRLEDEVLVLRTSYLQQKAIQVEGSVLISSDLFPAELLCEHITNINFESRTVSIDRFRFVSQSPTQRKSIRLAPEEEHTASLFYRELKTTGEVSVVDLSVEAVKLKILALPAGMKKEEPVRVDIVLTHAGRPLIINTHGTIYTIRELPHEFHVIVLMELGEEPRKKLVDYLAHRQISLIREFKGLQYA